MTMEAQLVEAMEDFTEQISGDVAETLRVAVITNLEDAEQGADGLVPYVREVDSNGDDHTFEIAHPTAPLHEVGGHIEPRYARAMSVGWDRDGFYEALEDCNEWVTEKRYVRDALQTVRREYKS